MNNWRPKGWEDDKFYRCMDLTGGGGEYADIFDVFESGADAMLETLRKTCPRYSQETLNGFGLKNTPKKYYKGNWYFIPDEV